MSGLIGYCNECHRVRWLARITVWLANGVPTGVCRSCDEEQATGGSGATTRRLGSPVASGKGTS